MQGHDGLANKAGKPASKSVATSTSGIVKANGPAPGSHMSASIRSRIATKLQKMPKAT
jgi:hypothetical protein